VVAAAAAPAEAAGDPVAALVAGSQRAQRLEVLVQLRKLYRNLLRASALLESPSPVYQPLQRTGAALRHTWAGSVRSFHAGERRRGTGGLMAVVVGPGRMVAAIWLSIVVAYRRNVRLEGRCRQA
jgi:hypothetical protein